MSFPVHSECSMEQIARRDLRGHPNFCKDWHRYYLWRIVQSKTSPYYVQNTLTTNAIYLALWNYTDASGHGEHRTRIGTSNYTQPMHTV